MPLRGWLLGCVDLSAWFVALLATAVVSAGVGAGPVPRVALVSFSAVVIAVQILAGWTVGLYSGRYRVGGYDETVALIGAWMAAALATTAIELVFPLYASMSLFASTLRAIAALAAMGFVRLSWRAMVERGLRPTVHGRRRVVVVGAGEGGYLIVRGMLTDPSSHSVPVALLDDDPKKAQRSIMGVHVEGVIDELGQVVRTRNASLVVIAIPSASSALIGRVVDKAKEAGVEVRTLPPTSELVAGNVGMEVVRPITENDLLGRAEVHVDLDQISRYVTSRKVLVTGAGGSIGSELCRQLAKLGPSRLLMLDRDESLLHATQLSIEGRALLDSGSLIVADVRDRDRIFDIFQDWEPDVVFHAAALKHLTLLEQHPMEGVKTNVFGTRNVIDAAVKTGAECVVNVSTDKAADPTSVLGASKLIAEQVAADAAQRTGERIVSVRFGNVLGSRGSVLPTFLRQIEAGGPVTVTHPDVTRFFMTIPEAVRLVLQAGAIGDPGEVMILDMGEPVRIVDLARRLIDHHNPGLEIEFTGLRPGEKLHEILVASHEVGTRREHPRVLHTSSPPADDLDCRLDQLTDASTVAADDLVGMVNAEPDPDP